MHFFTYVKNIISLTHFEFYILVAKKILSQSHSDREVICALAQNRKFT